MSDMLKIKYVTIPADFSESTYKNLIKYLPLVLKNLFCYSAISLYKLFWYFFRLAPGWAKVLNEK